MKFFFLVLFSSALVFANALQDAIDAAPPYATLKLQNALYKGNIHIDKPLKIIGIGEHVIIKGDGIRSVISIRSSDVILKHLSIQNSGMNMQSIDAAISIKQVQNCEISDCNISEVLYGIDMDRVDNCIISHNYITTKKNNLPLRANALKLYYANYNIIESNIIENVRDVTLNYSHHNLFKKNQFIGNRFATHLSLSHNNRFIDNNYRHNSVAMMFMGAKNTTVIGNEILSSDGAAGIGAMIGAVSNFVFKNNRVSFNAKGLYIQGQEKAKGMKRYIIGNEIYKSHLRMSYPKSLKTSYL
jgi:nitrous oxidase accessory protein